MKLFKKKRKKYYKTYAIDEATYLVMNKMDYTVKSISNRRSEFTFLETRKLKKLRVRFWSSKSVKIDLNKWFLVRSQLKYHAEGLHKQSNRDIRLGLKEKPVSNVKTKRRKMIGITQPSPPFPIEDGTHYWFVGNNGLVCSNPYKKGRKAHIDRIKAGNFYQTQQEAVINLHLYR